MSDAHDLAEAPIGNMTSPNLEIYVVLWGCGGFSAGTAQRRYVCESTSEVPVDKEWDKSAEMDAKTKHGMQTEEDKENIS